MRCNNLYHVCLCITASICSRKAKHTGSDLHFSVYQHEWKGMTHLPLGYAILPIVYSSRRCRQQLNVGTLCVSRKRLPRVKKPSHKDVKNLRALHTVRKHDSAHAMVAACVYRG